MEQEQEAPLWTSLDVDVIDVHRRHEVQMLSAHAAACAAVSELVPSDTEGADLIAMAKEDLYRAHNILLKLYIS